MQRGASLRNGLWLLWLALLACGTPGVGGGGGADGAMAALPGATVLGVRERGPYLDVVVQDGDETHRRFVARTEDCAFVLTPEAQIAFDSTGLAIQDVALAQAIFDAARAQGLGKEVDFTGIAEK